jgi:hypothetical protein
VPHAALTTWQHHREMWDQWKEASGEGDGDKRAASDARSAFIQGLLQRSQQESTQQSSVQSSGGSEAKAVHAKISGRRRHHSSMVHLDAMLCVLVVFIMSPRNCQDVRENGIHSNKHRTDKASTFCDGLASSVRMSVLKCGCMPAD